MSVRHINTILIQLEEIMVFFVTKSYHCFQVRFPFQLKN